MIFEILGQDFIFTVLLIQLAVIFIAIGFIIN